MHTIGISDRHILYIPRNMYAVFALLCFVVVIHWLIFPYPPGLLHWHCGNLTIAPVPAKQPWWIWINTSCEFIMNDCITTTKQSTTKPCAYFLGYTVWTSDNDIWRVSEGSSWARHILPERLNIYGNIIHNVYITYTPNKHSKAQAICVISGAHLMYVILSNLFVSDERLKLTRQYSIDLSTQGVHLYVIGLV